MFVRGNQAQAVLGIEVVVDTSVVLITIDFVAVSVRQVETILAPDETDVRGVQTIAAGELIR